MRAWPTSISGGGIHSTMPLRMVTVQPSSARRLSAPQARTSSSMLVCAALGPAVDVMDLGAVAGHGAAGFGAAAVAGVQHDAVGLRGRCAWSPAVEGFVGVLVEHDQVVDGVAGHPDQIRHRQQGPAGGHPGPAGRRGPSPHPWLRCSPRVRCSPRRLRWSPRARCSPQDRRRSRRSCRVVETITVTGKPLCWPSSPEARALRPMATNASC